jgi:hypothetical protein
MNRTKYEILPLEDGPLNSIAGDTVSEDTPEYVGDTQTVSPVNENSSAGEHEPVAPARANSIAGASTYKNYSSRTTNKNSNNNNRPPVAVVVACEFVSEKKTKAKAEPHRTPGQQELWDTLRSHGIHGKTRHELAAMVGLTAEAVDRLAAENDGDVGSLVLMIRDDGLAKVAEIHEELEAECQRANDEAERREREAAWVNERREEYIADSVRCDAMCVAFDAYCLEHGEPRYDMPTLAAICIWKEWELSSVADGERAATGMSPEAHRGIVAHRIRKQRPEIAAKVDAKFDALAKGRKKGAA